MAENRAPNQNSHSNNGGKIKVCCFGVFFFCGQSEFGENAHEFMRLSNSWVTGIPACVTLHTLNVCAYELLCRQQRMCFRLFLCCRAHMITPCLQACVWPSLRFTGLWDPLSAPFIWELFKIVWNQLSNHKAFQNIWSTVHIQFKWFNWQPLGKTQQQPQGRSGL